MNPAEEIETIGFSAPIDTLDGIELLDMTTLRARLRRRRLTGLQRPTFHLILGVVGGDAVHQIDFVDYPLAAGSVLWVRPGQVQRWGDLDAMDGTMAIVEPAFAEQIADPLIATALRHGAVSCPDDRSGSSSVLTALDDLATEYRAATSGEALGADLVRYRLALLILRFLAAQEPADDASSPIPESLRTAFGRFREEVERGFATRRSVEEYAMALNYSVSTLVRAVRAVTGRSPKAYLDERVVLEAKRLLAHSDASIASIAHQLGFDDAANFSKFFRQRAGVLPSEFRTPGTRAVGAQ